MKTFSVAVAVAVVLTFICIQERSAFPFAGVKELEEPMSNDDPVAAENEEVPAASQKMPFNIRQKRQLQCRLCCHTNSRGVRSCIKCCS